MIFKKSYKFHEIFLQKFRNFCKRIFKKILNEKFHWLATEVASGPRCVCVCDCGWMKLPFFFFHQKKKIKFLGNQQVQRPVAATAAVRAWCVDQLWPTSALLHGAWAHFLHAPTNFVLHFQPKIFSQNFVFFFPAKWIEFVVRKTRKISHSCVLFYFVTRKISPSAGGEKAKVQRTVRVQQPL